MQGMMEAMTGGEMMKGMGLFWLLGLALPVLAVGVLIDYTERAAALRRNP